jgi:hypothetical protein
MRLPRAASILALSLLVPASALAGPAIGFIERFNTGTISTWGGGALLSNPGTGGADGAGDGYLKVERTDFASSLATRSDGLEYNGDWRAANVNKINVCLNDVGANQALEIHCCIGNSESFWIYKPGFAPPENAWGLFSVDLADTTKWARLMPFDTKSYSWALQNADRLHFRHDTLPYVQSADAVLGDFGIDNVELTSSLLDAGTLPTSAGRPVELSAPYPNPARGRIACAFDTFDAGLVRVAIIDAAGRIVRAEALAGMAPGRRTWVWDGLDGQGRTAAAGSYRVRVTGTSGGTSRAFVLLR